MLTLLLLSGVPEIVGVSDSALAGVTSNSVASVDLVGVAAKVLSPLLASSSASTVIVGSSSKTLSGLSVSSVAQISTIGYTVKSLSPLTALSSGSISVVGITVLSGFGLSASSTGGVSVQGSLSSSLGLSSQSSTSVSSVGVSINTLQPLQIASTSTVSVAGSLSKVLQNVIGGSGVSVETTNVVGQSLSSFAPISLSSNGALSVVGTASSVYFSGLSLVSAAKLDVFVISNSSLYSSLSSLGSVSVVGFSSPVAAGLYLSSQVTGLISGNVAVDLDALSVTSNSRLSSNSSLTSYLDDLERDVTGRVSVEALLEEQLDVLYTSSAVQSDVGSELSGTLTSFCESEGRVDLSGELQRSLEDVSTSSSAIPDVSGFLSSLLDDVISSSDSFVVVFGQADLRNQDVTLQSVCETQLIGISEAAALSSTISSDGRVDISASYSQPLDGLISDISSRADAIGESVSLLQDLTGLSLSENRVLGNSVQKFSDLSSSSLSSVRIIGQVGKSLEGLYIASSSGLSSFGQSHIMLGSISSVSASNIAVSGSSNVFGLSSYISSLGLSYVKGTLSQRFDSLSLVSQFIALTPSFGEVRSKLGPLTASGTLILSSSGKVYSSFDNMVSISQAAVVGFLTKQVISTKVKRRLVLASPNNKRPNMVF